MTRLLTVALLVLAFAPACDDEVDAIDEFRAAFPDEATLDVALPDDPAAESVAAGLSVTEAPLVGELSNIRVQTALARRFLVRSFGEMLGSYRDMTARKPVKQTRDRVAWWKRADDGLEHLLVMNRDGDDGHFVFTAWMRERPSLAERPNWKFLVFGSITPGDTVGDGRGALWINLDNDKKPRTHGKVIVLFSEVGATRDLDIRTYDAATDGEAVITRGFRYHDVGGVGAFAFDAGQGDVHSAASKPGLERLRIVTRWNGKKGIRGDLTAMGPEVDADRLRAMVFSECWQADEGIVLYEQRLGLPVSATEPVVIREAGAPGLCPFPRPAIAIVPEPDEAPSEPGAPPEADPTLDWK